MIGTVDVETYSEAGYRWTGTKWGPLLGVKKTGLQVVGSPAYAEHPSTEMLSLWYSIPGHEGLWLPYMNEGPLPLFDFIKRGGLMESCNSMFEFLIWHYVCHMRLGWPPLPLEQQRCSAAKAQNWGLPASLENAGKAIQTVIKKDTKGKNLIKLCSCPKQPSKKDPSLRRTHVTHPELFIDLYRYNKVDVDSEKDLSKRIPDLSPQELEVWLLNQKINWRGVQVDKKMLHALMDLITRVYERHNSRLRQITGGAVETVDKTIKLLAWLKTKGVISPSCDKEHVQLMLDNPNVPPECKDALRIRKSVSGAATKKLWSMKARMSEDGRLRDIFRYCGADRTGRFSSVGTQLHNMKGSGPDCARCSSCRGIAVKTKAKTCHRCGHGTMEAGVIEWSITTMTQFFSDVENHWGIFSMEGIWGSLIEVTGASIRGLLIAAERHDLISADYHAIEAVVIAMLANEQWRIDVFRNDGKIYEASASKASGIPLAEILAHKKRTGNHHPARKIGKVRELADGYGGWIGANKNFGMDQFMSDAEIKADIIAWRDESPNIVEFWGGQWRKHPTEWEFTHEHFGLEGAVVNALLNRGTTHTVGLISYTHSTNVDVLYCRLPSGRFLSYHQPRLKSGLNRMCKKPEYKIHYMGWNSDSKAGAIGWIEFQTYSGKLAENVTQAVAGDILKYAMVNLYKRGYFPVIHVHDEITAEILKGTGSIEEFESIMNIMAPWAKGWPIRVGGGWRGLRFRK